MTTVFKNNTPADGLKWQPRQGEVEMLDEGDQERGIRSAGAWLVNGYTRTPELLVSVRNPESWELDGKGQQEKPQPPKDPIVKEEWKTNTNTIPNEKALKENGTLKLGSGIKGTYATVANDGVIELTLIPMIPGSKALGPAGSDGIFTKTEKGDISCFFGVTSLKYPLKDVIDLYDSITLDVINDGEVVQKMDLQLHKNGWFNEDGELLEGTYIDEYTIQEATRVSFFTEKGKENKFVLSANSKEGNESIEVTVIDEYVEPEEKPEETPEKEPEVETPEEEVKNPEETETNPNDSKDEEGSEVVEPAEQKAKTKTTKSTKK